MSKEVKTAELKSRNRRGGKKEVWARSTRDGNLALTGARIAKGTKEKHRSSASKGILSGEGTWTTTSEEILYKTSVKRNH